MKVLMIGDVFGNPGRKVVEHTLAKLQWDYDIDFTVLNGENATNGRGINQASWKDLEPLGIDVFTMGNHVWDNKDIYRLANTTDKLVRPLNLPSGSPGQGYGIYQAGQYQIGVINLLGRVYMPQPTGNCPFEAFQRVIEEIRQVTPIVLVDFHAEVTSEKQAFGWFAAGRASAVLGTHTHVQTNDARILPPGTAFISDVGMTGPRDSILGLEREAIIQKFIHQQPVRFEVAQGALQLNAVVVEIDPATGKALDIVTIREEFESIE